MSGPIAARLHYLLKLSRPRFWLYLAGPVLVGAAFGAQTRADLVAPFTVAMFLYFLLPANILLYGVNDRFDLELDAANPKKDGREARYAGGRGLSAAIAACGLGGLALLLAAPPPARPWLAGFLILAVAYSAPPARLKTRPPADSISNGLYILPGLAMYAALAGQAPPAAAVLGGWLWTMAMHTFSAIPDIPSDQAAGVATTATRLGRDRTLAYCGLCWLGAALAFGLLAPAAGLLLGAYPVLALLIARWRIEVDRAYWWFPAINALVGMVLTWAGLWRLAFTG